MFTYHKIRSDIQCICARWLWDSKKKWGIILQILCQKFCSQDSSQAVYVIFVQVRFFDSWFWRIHSKKLRKLNLNNCILILKFLFQFTFKRNWSRNFLLNQILELCLTKLDIKIAEESIYEFKFEHKLSDIIKFTISRKPMIFTTQ